MFYIKRLNFLIEKRSWILNKLIKDSKILDSWLTWPKNLEFLILDFSYSMKKNATHTNTLYSLISWEWKVLYNCLWSFLAHFLSEFLVFLKLNKIVKPIITFFLIFPRRLHFHLANLDSRSLFPFKSSLGFNSFSMLTTVKFVRFR